MNDFDIAAERIGVIAAAAEFRAKQADAALDAAMAESRRIQDFHARCQAVLEKGDLAELIRFRDAARAELAARRPMLAAE